MLPTISRDKYLAWMPSNYTTSKTYPDHYSGLVALGNGRLTVRMVFFRFFVNCLISFTSEEYNGCRSNQLTSIPMEQIDSSLIPWLKKFSPSIDESYKLLYSMSLLNMYKQNNKWTT